MLKLKRYFFSSAWKFIFISFVIFYLYSCEKNKKSTGNELVFPEETHTLIKINDKKEFISQIKNHFFWKNYKSVLSAPHLLEILATFPTEKNIWVANADENFYFLVLIDSLLPKESVWKQLSENEVDSVFVNQKQFFYTLEGQKLLVSDNLKMLTFSQDTETNTLKKLYKILKTADENVPVNLFLNKNQTKEFLSPIFAEKTFDEIENWSSWDIAFDKNEIRLNGTAFHTNNHSGVSSLGNFKETKAIDFETQVPENAISIRHYSFSNVENLTTDITFETNLLQYATGVTFFNRNLDSLALLHSSNIEETANQLLVYQEETYQNLRMFSLENNTDLYSLFDNFNDFFVPKFGVVFQNSLLFSKNKQVLQQVVNELQTNITLQNDSKYRSLKQKMTTESAYSEIKNLQKNVNFTKKIADISERYPFASLQITPSEDFFIYSIVAVENTQQPIHSEIEIKEKYQLTIDAEAKIPPKWVLNHNTKRKEIIIQDVESNLYLFDNQGNRIWKKKMNAPINENIFQVDLFQNEKLQFAFTTQHSLCVIDRNGENVAPFPITFRYPLLPLQVFDYENKKDYRFMIAMKNRLRLLDKKGNEITGFQLREVPEGVHQTPKHFRIEDKDFIVFPKSNGNLGILHRNGSVRVPLSNSFSFSENNIFLRNNLFTFSTNDGKVIGVDINGNIKTEDTKHSEYHHISYRYDIQAIMHGNKLRINQKEMELPYGNYTKPHIFKVGKNIYISVCDVSNSKLFLISSEGKIVKNFPIFGISSMDMTIDNGNAQIAFLRDKQTIFVYELK